MSARHSTRIFTKLVLLALGLAAGLALAEATLRLSIPDTRAELFRHTTETERWKVMKPDYEGVVHGVPLRTNALGFRDAKPGPIAPKQPGQFRAVVLGDSFTVCAGVPFEELATSRLRALLARAVPGPAPDVVNLGTAGYAIIEYAMVLDEVALGLEPDCAIVALYVPNDFEVATWRDNREIALGHRTVQEPGWFESLYLNRAFGPTISALWQRVLPRKAQPAAQGIDEGWSENTKALLQLAARTREKGIPLRVCLLPHPSNFARQAARHEQVARFCREHGIAVTDVLPRLVASGKSPRAFRLNAIDSHPNAAYNQIVAAAMSDAIADVASAFARRQETR